MEKLLAELADIPLTIDPALVKQKSRDFFWYSPVLNRQLRHCTAQAVITPRDEADVVRVAAACVRHRVPITARGGVAVLATTVRRCRCTAGWCWI
jgi:FAD/FMN-containing dehydrogenase